MKKNHMNPSFLLFEYLDSRYHSLVVVSKVARVYVVEVIEM